MDRIQTPPPKALIHKLFLLSSLEKDPRARSPVGKIPGREANKSAVF